MFTQNSFEPFEKAIIAVMKINMDLILNNYMNSNLKDFILLNTSCEKIKHAMKFDMDIQLRDSFFEEYCQ